MVPSEELLFRSWSEMRLCLKRTNFALRRIRSDKSFKLVYALCHGLLSLRRSDSIWRFGLGIG